MGCKSNQLEGSLIEENLINNGFKKAENAKDADFFILNSCTVTHKSDNEAFSIIKRAKKDNSSIKTVLTGCIAQIEKDKLLENPNIDIVVGNDEKLKLANFLNEKIAVNDIMQLDRFHNVHLKNTSKTRASLKIQDGCNNRCSYCIIPFARGKNRSADSDFIIEQIKLYEDMGFKEIVLTGIHIGQWGLDFKDKKKFLHLLENIENKTRMPRYRLGSLNPLEIDDEMLEFLSSSEKFCPHFHLSLQSMCNETLKSMNRHYSVERAMELIKQISEIFPYGFIGSDVIAGFAGETEQHFQTTIENLKKSQLSQIHTFPYSIRQGTIAEKLPNHLDSKTKELRASLIKEISAQKHNEFLQKNSGQILEVLIEKNLDKKTGMLKGVTQNYINVLIESQNSLEQEQDYLKNTIQKVKIRYEDKYISGKIIQSN